MSGGKLASPWGITLAASSFGQFGGDLLVGNFSYLATEINAFDPVSGAYLGTLTDGSGNPLLVGNNGLWDLTFGIGGNGGLPGTLYFATGLNNEANGLFGAIHPALSIAGGGAVANVAGATIANLSDSFLVAAAGSTLTVEHTAFTGNQAIGGVGGNGGASGNGGNGNGGNGGAITNVGQGSTVLVTYSTFTGNQA